MEKVPSHMFLEMESRRRIEEYRREAAEHRRARLAHGERRQWMPLKFGQHLAHLKCRVLDLLVGLGFAVERCLIAPEASARESR